MSVGREEILNAALRLPEADRLLIATRLLDTLPEDASGLSMDDAHLLAELERRAADNSPTVPAADLWKQS